MNRNNLVPSFPLAVKACLFLFPLPTVVFVVLLNGMDSFLFVLTLKNDIVFAINKKWVESEIYAVTSTFFGFVVDDKYVFTALLMDGLLILGSSERILS